MVEFCYRPFGKPLDFFGSAAAGAGAACAFGAAICAFGGSGRTLVGGFLIAPSIASIGRRCGGVLSAIHKPPISWAAAQLAVSLLVPSVRRPAALLVLSVAPEVWART